MTRIYLRPALRAAIVMLGGAMLAACEDAAYFVQDNPEVVRTVAEREILIVDERF